jgi:signal transduction histidine kinase
VRLPPLVRDLQIDYTALSLVAPEKNRFRYKLEGRDGTWQDVGNRRQAFYTDLDPGDYRFHVIASNNRGVWNEQGATLDFSIAPAYWQTNGFRVACVAAFLLVLWALYQLRVRHLRRQFNMTLDARVGERTRIARELHDTLLQSFHGLLLRFQTAMDLLPNRATEAKQVLGSAIDQAAEAITEGRDAVQGLRSSTQDTNDLADALRALGEQLAADEGAGKGVILRVESKGGPRTLHPIVRDEIVRIAGEALRNAFRHANAKQIEVELHYDDRSLRLRVRDDGKGIDPKVLEQGGREGHFGIHGMRERAKLIGGKLTLWSGLDDGTEVELAIPASHAYTSSSSTWLGRLAQRLQGQRTNIDS